MHLIIPMSGIGKRFLDAGYNRPKPLIEVDGKPMIEHVVNLFPGVDRTTFIANDEHLSKTDMREILLGIVPNATILEVERCSKAGPVDVIATFFDSSLINDEEEIIVSYCDYSTVWNFNAFLSSVRKSNADGAIACYKGFHPHMLGTDNYAFVKEDNGVLVEIREKQCFTDDRMSEFASNGTYYFKSGKLLKKYFNQLIDSNQKINNEYYVSMVYNFMVKDFLRVDIFEIEKMLQWGTPYDLQFYKGWSNYFSNKSKTKNKAKNPPNTTTIIPAAGKGNRFFEMGYATPKPLLKVDEKPMIISAVDCLPESDVTTFVCLKEHVQRHDIEEQIKSYLPNSSVLHLDKVTQGQACTCEIAIDKFGINPEHPIMISACDNGVIYDIEEYQKILNDENVDVIVWSFRNNQASKSNPNAYAWLEVDKSGYIKNVSCKKFIYDDPLTTHAIIGTMFFRKAKFFLEGLRSNYEEKITTNNEYYVDDVLNQNIKKGLRVKVFEATNYICWGTPNDYKTYQYWKEYFTGIKDQ